MEEEDRAIELVI